MDARAALAGLLGERRLAWPGPRAGFRFEGVLELALQMQRAGSDAARPFDRVVAGESFKRGQLALASFAGACRGRRKHGPKSARTLRRIA